MIVPTRRLLLAALLGIVPIVLSGSAGLGIFVGVLWLVTLAALAVVDSRLTPQRNSLIWERRHESKLSLGAANPITLVLHNRSERPARFRLRDAVPQLLGASGESGEGECGPTQVWTMTYHVYPMHRGDYSLGPLTARYLSPLGLAWRQHAWRTEDSVKVYPNLLAIRQYDALVRRGHLEEIGLRRARRLGSGTEFERLREYTPDDEFRRINWTATARRHTPIATEYQTERSQNVTIVLDTGRLMSAQVPYPGELEETVAEAEPKVDAPSGVGRALTRLDHSINAALLLAYVSLQSGDRVGLLAFDQRVSRFVKPGPGRKQFLLLTEVLYDVQPSPVEADYEDALAFLGVQNPRRSLVVLFTDIAHEAAAESLERLMGRLARRHLPLVVTMRDPAVDRLASQPVGEVRQVYERAVAQVSLDQRAAVLARLRQHGALTLDVSADRLTPSVINSYLEIKARSAL